MKRLIGLLAVAALTFGLALSAHANVFDGGGNYLLKYSGSEFAVDESGKLLSEGDLHTDGVLNSGYYLNSVMLFTGVYEVPGEDPYGQQNKTNLIGGNADQPGVYLAVMTDLFVNDQTTGTIYDGKLVFEGGRLALYKIDDLFAADFNKIEYVSGVGFMIGNDSDSMVPLDLSGYTPFVEYDLSGESVTSVNKYGHLAGDAKLVGNIAEDQKDQYAAFDNDRFDKHGNADLVTSATVNWNDGLSGFMVEDPARISVAAPTPEPGTLILMSLGLLGAGLCARRRRSH